MLRLSTTYKLKESTGSLSQTELLNKYSQVVATLKILVERQPLPLRPDVKPPRQIGDHPNALLFNRFQFPEHAHEVHKRETLLEDQKKWLADVRNHCNDCFDYLSADKKQKYVSENSQNVIKDLQLAMETFNYVIGLIDNASNSEKHESLFNQVSETILEEEKKGHHKNHTKSRLKFLNGLMAMMTIAAAFAIFATFAMNPILFFGAIALTSLLAISTVVLAKYRSTKSFEQYEFVNSKNLVYKLHKQTQTLFSLVKVNAITVLEGIEKPETRFH